MNQKLKKTVLSCRVLTKIAIFFNKQYLKKRFSIKYRKNVFIGFSTICEGKNSFASNSSLISSYIGYGSYLAEGTRLSKTKIGKYCSIGPNVNCIFGKHPSHTFVSTHPAFFTSRSEVGITYANKQLFKEFADTIDLDGKYSIVIGHDVWIGANVSIMDGVTIGHGSIIAANTLVNKDVPPYSIVGGVPSKPIKKRFTDEQIEFLLQFEWWNKQEEWIFKNAAVFTDISNFYRKFSNA